MMIAAVLLKAAAASCNMSCVLAPHCDSHLLFRHFGHFAGLPFVFSSDPFLVSSGSADSLPVLHIPEQYILFGNSKL